MKKYKVYKFTNLLNDKAYIGITSKEDPVERYKEHLESARLGNVPQNHHYGAIHAALNKYGKDNFFFEVIEEYDDVNDCKNAEIANIAKYKTYVRDEKGYNLTKGGDGLGLVISEEARLKHPTVHVEPL